MEMENSVHREEVYLRFSRVPFRPASHDAPNNYVEVKL